MNNGAAILLYDAEGNVSGGDVSADPRGGIFGAQGYGGGLFDGSTGLGGIGDTVDCAATCASLMLLPVTGPTLAAFCLSNCNKGAPAPSGCSIPGECAAATARYPSELPAALLKDYCGFPAEVQQSIATACKSLAALPPGTVLPKDEPVPPFVPGVLDDPAKAPPTPQAEAGIGLGTVAVVGVAVLGVGWLIWGKKR